MVLPDRGILGCHHIASQVGKVGTGGTSVFSNIRASLRARAIANALSRGNWFLHSGWSNGSMRTDIAIVHWQSVNELRDLARRIAIQIETFGDKWQVLVLGQQIKTVENRENGECDSLDQKPAHRAILRR